jgi:hypothetical protein
VLQQFASLHGLHTKISRRRCREHSTSWNSLQFDCLGWRTA